MLNIILTGSPGSGKGTQSEVIQKKYGLEHLSTGDVLRTEIASGSALGQELHDIMSKGLLVSDDIVIRVINSFIDSRSKDCKGIIFDGFPRTLVQAQALDKSLKERHLNAYLIHILVEEKEVIARLLNRGKTSGRDDDNLTSIQQRLSVYHEQTAPICEYYLKEHNYFAVNGNYDIETTFSQIDTLLSLLK